MAEQQKLSDLFIEAVSDHGKASADLLRRVGRGDEVDYLAEALNCTADLTRTVSRFILFWDNIATLLAADPREPVTSAGPAVCDVGEIQTFQLRLQSAGPAAPQSGLRRRGEVNESIPQTSIAVSRGPKGEVVVKVDCGGQPRGVYEGSMQVVDAAANQTVHPYNVYINPGAQLP
jgi:hypothetical protein